MALAAISRESKDLTRKPRSKRWRSRYDVSEIVARLQDTGIERRWRAMRHFGERGFVGDGNRRVGPKPGISGGG